MSNPSSQLVITSTIELCVSQTKQTQRYKISKWKGECGITSEYVIAEPLHPKPCLYFTHILAEPSVGVIECIIFPYISYAIQY